MSKNPFGNMGDLLKQAQAMQERLGKIQEKAATKTVEASAGGRNGNGHSKWGDAGDQGRH